MQNILLNKTSIKLLTFFGLVLSLSSFLILWNALRSSAIVGGETASQYSWMVAFVEPNDGDRPIEDRIICSGVLISPTKVLSSKHCTLAGSVAVIGRADLQNTTNSTTRTIEADDIEVYSATESEGDLKLVTLDSATDLGYMKVARSYHAADWNPGERVRSYGYGCTSLTDTSTSRYLRRAEFEVVTMSPSGPEALEYGYHAPYFFIARWDGRSICPGDSGGPTIVSTSDGPRLVGINSRAPYQSNFYSKVGNRGTTANSPLFYWLYNKGILP